jgi:uncharacterized protein Smg (DUF494 family)
MIINDRIKRIIEYLMDFEVSDFKDPALLHSELEDMGYSYEEISQALNMLDLEPATEDHGYPSDGNARPRVLGEPEKLILSTEAQGHLIKLHQLGWLTETQLNLIIENASMEYNPPVSIDEIKEIIGRYASDIPDNVPADTTGPSSQVH